MKIASKRNYQVTKYVCGNQLYDLGILPGTDVRRLLKNCEYDERFGLWFTEKATLGYEVKPV